MCLFRHPHGGGAREAGGKTYHNSDPLTLAFQEEGTTGKYPHVQPYMIILVVQGMKPRDHASKCAIILLYSCPICIFIYIHIYPSELHMYITYKLKLTISFLTAKIRKSSNLRVIFLKIYLCFCVWHLCIHAYRSRKRGTD